MEYNLEQLLKRRCKQLEDNPIASDILLSLLDDKDGVLFNAPCPNCIELSTAKDDLKDVYIENNNILINNDVDIYNNNEFFYEGEYIKLTLSSDNSFSLSYCKYFVTNNNHVIQSFVMSFSNGKIVSENIGEWVYSRKTPKITDYLYETLTALYEYAMEYNRDFYDIIKYPIVERIYKREGILPDTYKELFIDANENKVSLNIDNATSEEEFDGNICTLINKFNNIKTSGDIDTRKQKMTNILLKINDVLEKNYTPKERQYILLNGSRKNKRDGN